MSKSPKVTQTWDNLNRKIVKCDRCPRLRSYCAQVASEKRASFRDWDYWGKPVPNFGDPAARLLIVGLAPAAHGANRTGRLFTGDRSGDWLYRALYRAGLSNQELSLQHDDGLELYDCAISDAGHCAPPDNRPTRQELQNCAHWLEATVEILPVQVFLALGGIAWKAMVDFARQTDQMILPRIPKFGHGEVVQLTEQQKLVGCYHPSPRNTSTGRLTAEMFDAVFETAKTLLK